jgi:3-dehydroshikimate dehydratase
VSATALRPGLCTVSFRALEPAEVVERAAAAGVEALEWGGDVHVPHGDLAPARRAADATAAAGLTVVSYGSYLFLDDGVGDHLDAVLDTARELGAPGVRVWCPFGVDADATEADRAVVTAAAARAAAAAAEQGLHLTVEFHGGTLTATAASARRLLDDVDSPALLSAWQPPYWDPRSDADEDADIALLGPRLSHVHVYDWDADGTRHPLARSAPRWAARLAVATDAGAAAVAAGVPRSALIEFVPDDDPAVLAAEVATVRRLLGALPPGGDLSG